MMNTMMVGYTVINVTKGSTVQSNGKLKKLTGMAAKVTAIVLNALKSSCKGYKHMKLKVTAFKPSGKYYTEETYPVRDYPSNYSEPDDLTLGQLRTRQSEFTYLLWEKIKNGEANEYCPVNDFKGFFFTFDAILDDCEGGFLTYLLDRTRD